MPLSKNSIKPLALSALTWCAILLSACSFSLAEDVTPPPNYTPPAPPETSVATVTELSYPVVPPDPANGAAIFTEKCAPCHGTTGHGDGPRASSLPNPVAAIGTGELARQSTPASWFNTITNGNLEHFMPPFNGSLSDGQRWDVLAYVYSLSETPASVVAGGQLYDKSCASCHGQTGKGDGPQASGTMASFTDQSFMAQKSEEDLYQAITTGVTPSMPAYENKFSDEQRRDLSSYIRFLSYSPSALAAYAASGSPLASAGTAYPVPTSPEASMATAAPTAYPLAATPQATANITATAPSTVTMGTITGKVTNGSGGSLPSGLEVALHGFDNMQLVLTDTAVVDSSGMYTMTNVAMAAGRVLIASTSYNNTTYSSNVATINPGTTTAELDINVYDTTTDASSLSVDRMHVFFDFGSPGVVQVVELYLITNPTNKTVVPDKPGNAVLSFKLPDGASNLQLQDGTLGDRYVTIPGGFGDTSPVIPGASQHQVLFGFNMPYTDKLELKQPVSLPVAAVVVLLPEDGVKLKSDALTDAGSRDVQGTTYQLYNGTKIDPGGSLDLTLTGNPSAGAVSPLAAASRNNLIIGLAALGLVLILVGVLLFRRSQPPRAAVRVSSEPLEQKDSEDLIDAIIALDDLYKEGKLPDEAYQQRRADLKAQLKERLG